MTAETLRAVTLDVLQDYRSIAKFAGTTFRQGSIKGFSKVDATVGGLMSNYEDKIGKNIKLSIHTAHQRLTNASNKADRSVGKLGRMMKDGIHDTQKKLIVAAHLSENMVDKVLGGASRRVTNFPAKNTLIARIMTNPVVAAVEPMGVPGARLLRFASSKIARGVEKLTVKAAGHNTVAAKKRAVRTKSKTKRGAAR